MPPQGLISQALGALLKHVAEDAAVLAATKQVQLVAGTPTMSQLLWPSL